MYRLMIVDDEKIIRDGLCSIIRWNELGFEVAAVAQNGADALRMLEQQPVDVLLTDIQMPQINGLHLARLAHEINPKIKLVVISGYSNFEYAREGIELRVESYILKPIEPKQVGEVFARMKAQMDQERKNEELILRARNQAGGTVFHIEQYCDEAIAYIEQGEYGVCRSALDAFALNLRQLSVSDAAQMCRFVLDSVIRYFDIGGSGAALEPLRADYDRFDALEDDFRSGMNACMEKIIAKADQMAVLLCRQAKAEIEGHYAEQNFSLSRIAGKLNVSYGYLSSIFTEHYKVSPKSYLIRVRMEKARELLLRRELKMYEIAAQVGYADPRYFSDAFRKHFGVSPSYHLKKIQNNKLEMKEKQT
ncbi:MAG TPA: response regulator [Clostridia bacterium]|nr:response regulator [Clostridia bacterium]HPK14846.1 response regulator [Clostridia bacterium]